MGERVKREKGSSTCWVCAGFARPLFESTFFSFFSRERK